MIYYIAGPMSGLPNFNLEAFEKAAAKLSKQGHQALNPATTNGGDVTHPGGRSWYLREAIRMLLNADAIAVLPGWEKSRGARLEVLIAQELGLPVFSYPSMTKLNHCIDPFRDYCPSLSEVLKNHDDTLAQVSTPGVAVAEKEEPPKHVPPKMIGLVGYAGSGKDSFFEALGRVDKRFKRFAFADELKCEVCEALGITCAELEENKQRYRELLQGWGVIRRDQEEDYWIKEVERVILHSNPDGNVPVITDVRFKNEIDWVKSKGGIIVRIERENVGPANGHISEHEWTSQEPDWAILNIGGYFELELMAKNFYAVNFKGKESTGFSVIQDTDKEGLNWKKFVTQPS